MKKNKEEKKLFSNLGTLKKGLKSFTNTFNSNQVEYKTVDDFVNLYKIPKCILKNPEFNLINEIFNVGDSIGNWQTFETPIGDKGNLVTYGIYYLKQNNNKHFFKNLSAIQFNFEIRSNAETSEVNSLKFNFKINEDEIVDKLISYPKSIDFQVFSRPENFKSKNDIENLNKIIKVSEKTYASIHFNIYFNEIGQRLQPLKNEWCAIELVGVSKPKSVNAVEGLLKEWQDFSRNTSSIKTKDFIR